MLIPIVHRKHVRNTEPKVVISGLILMGNCFKNKRAEPDNIPGNIVYHTVPSNEGNIWLLIKLIVELPRVRRSLWSPIAKINW